MNILIPVQRYICLWWMNILMLVQGTAKLESNFFKTFQSSQALQSYILIPIYFPCVILCFALSCNSLLLRGKVWKVARWSHGQQSFLLMVFWEKYSQVPMSSKHPKVPCFQSLDILSAWVSSCWLQEYWRRTEQSVVFQALIARLCESTLKEWR